MTTDFPEGRSVATNGVRLTVHEAGPAHAPPVVLCHGWPEIAYSWRHQIPALAGAGYRVLAPDQRGYADSDRPEDVTAYDIDQLTGDLTGLLDHYGLDRAVFVGHDWGAIVVWNLALLHPDRVVGVANLSVPFLERGAKDWVSFWEERLGGDHYIVHFNRQPGVADAVLERNTRRFLGNLYRTGQWREAPPPAPAGMPLLALAESDTPRGEPLMSAAELDVFVRAFERSGFTGGINWYRNFTRNWERLANVEQRIEHPALMIYGRYDMVPKLDRLADFVPGVETETLDCGHWIQQEQPEATNRILLDWLATHYPSARPHGDTP